ncbi:MAG: TolC family protein [Candidatus Binatia bacterium]
MRIFLFGSLLFLSLVGAARAEDGWTWERFVDAAKSGNPDLAAARAAVERAEAAAAGAYTAYLPQLSLSSDYSRRGGSSSSRDGGFDPSFERNFSSESRDSFSSGDRDSFSTTLNARQGLFTGFRRGGEVDQGQAGLAEARAAFASVGAQVTSDLASAFAELVYAQQQVDLAKEILARRQENVRLIELRYEAGREHKGSFLRIAAAARQAEADLASANRAVAVAQRQIARVIGSDQAATLRAEGTFAEAKPDRPLDFRAIAASVPAHQQALARRQRAEAAVTVAKSQFYPSLDAVASTGRRDDRFPPEDDSWSAGLSLSFPLFSGGKSFFDVRGAEAESLRAKWDAAAAQEQAVLDLERAFSGYEDAAENVVVQKQFLDAAETRAEIARAQYTNGLLSFDDWDLIENDLIQTRKNTLAGRRDAALARARWELASGTVGV